MSEQMDIRDQQKQIFQLALSGIVLTFFSFLLFFILTAVWVGQPVVAVLDIFKDNIFFPHYNNFNHFFAGKMKDVPVLLWYYAFMAVTVVLGILFLKGVTRPLRHNPWATMPRIISTTAMITTLFFCFMQHLKTTAVFKDIKNQFGGKTTVERNKILFGRLYEFARICQEQVKGDYMAQLQSDVSFSYDPQMTQQSQLYYHLYPKAVWRIVNNNPEKAKIYFYKKNALQAIPKDYQAVVKTNDQWIVLAVEKEEIKKWKPDSN